MDRATSEPPTPQASGGTAGRDRVDHATAPATVLRVLCGLHAGAEVGLDGRTTLSIGSDESCDVVLRDQGVAPSHVSIVPGAPTMARALAPGVAVAGHAMAVGALRALTHHALLQIGSAVLALGHGGMADWPLPQGPSMARDARVPVDIAHARPSESPPAGPSGATPGTCAGQTGARERPAGFDILSMLARRRMPAAIGITAAIALAGGAAAAYRASPGPRAAAARHVAMAGNATGSDRERLGSILKDLHLDDVRVGQDSAGSAVLSGVVPDAAARSALERRLAATGLRVELHVTAAATLVQDVREIFRVNGFSVAPRYVPGGVVWVDGAPASEARLDAIVAHALHDIPGLVALRVQPAAPAPTSPPSPPVVARSPAAPEPTAEELLAKRIAAVVDGSPSYVATADGARYFVGATLPQGYRITAIDSGAVSVETVEGRRLVMKF